MQYVISLNIIMSAKMNINFLCRPRRKFWIWQRASVLLLKRRLIYCRVNMRANTFMFYRSRHNYKIKICCYFIMRKGSKMRIPNSLLNIYLILALIGLIVGLFIYNYFKLREGLVDENAIRNYISYISFKDFLPEIPKTINIDNNDYSTNDLTSIRYKLYAVLAKYSKFKDPSNNQLNNTLTKANKLINNITQNNYKERLSYQSYLDNVFLKYLKIYLKINTPDNFFEFMETNKDDAHIIALNNDKRIKYLRPASPL